MATIKRIAGSSATIGTSALDSLAAGSSVLLTEYDNATNLWPVADFEFVLDFASAPTDNAQMELWVVPAWDGTNYAAGDASVPARANLSIGALLVRNDAAAQRLVMRDVPIPACKFKLLIKNSTAQALAGSSANTVKIFPHGLESV